MKKIRCCVFFRVWWNKNLMEISYHHFSKLKKGFSKRRNTTQQTFQRQIFWTPTLNQRFCFKQQNPLSTSILPRQKKHQPTKTGQAKNPTSDRTGDYRGESVKVLRRSRLSSTSRGRLCCCWLAICAQHLDVWMWDLDDVFLFLK